MSKLSRELAQCHDREDLVGTSAGLAQILAQVRQVAPTDTTVLLLGETGTGKDLIATEIHRRSRRAGRPLVRVNCAALPEALIESELFGHEKGAFTGAESARPGRFELANGGTIVLDEIGELPLALQAKLLRVLQSGEIERLGATRTHCTDTRVIAATNRDLAAMVEVGEFRVDLFYRLNVFPITLPPLRERCADIPLLTEHFIRELSPKLGRKGLRVPDRAMAQLVAYDWPGNIRELENVIERSMICSPANGLGNELVIEGLPRTSATDGPPPAAAGRTAPIRTLDEVERAHIRDVCALCNWRINGAGNAAECLGLHPNTLRSKMKRLGIERPARVPRADAVAPTLGHGPARAGVQAPGQAAGPVSTTATQAPVGTRRVPACPTGDLDLILDPAVSAVTRLLKFGPRS